MADDDYGYQDDFYDIPNSPAPSNNHRQQQQQQLQQQQHRNNNQEEEDYDDEQHRYHNRKNQDDDDDEQSKQHLTGKMEHLQQRIEDLENELENERKQSLEMNKKYEEEVKLAWNSQVKAEEKVQALEKQAQAAANNGGGESSKDEIKELKKEITKLKKENEGLQDRVELLMITSSGKATNHNDNGKATSGGDAVPLTLEEEFHRYCKRNDVFPELNERVLSVDDCVKVLRHASNTRTKSGKAKSLRDDTAAAAASDVDGGSTAGGGITTEAKNKLHERVRALERELRAASVAAEDGDGLKNRIFQLSERIRIEKDQKRVLEGDLNTARRKIEMLSDHVEKLVTHLKREGAHKVRLAEQLRLTEKEGQRIREKADIIHRKSAAKDRLVLELREGSKVLEDQLRLMDEKYLELRGKLDYTRNVTGKKIRKAEKEASDLRVKFAMSGGSGVLDSYKLPTSAQSQPGTSSFEYGGLDGDSWNSEYYQPPRSDSPPAGKQRKAGGMKGSKSTSNMQISFENTVSTHQSKSSSQPSMDVVLEKIRIQQGAKQEWTEDRIKKLTKGH